MEGLMNRARKHALAGLLGLGLASSAFAQQPLPAGPTSLPPGVKSLSVTDSAPPPPVLVVQTQPAQTTPTTPAPAPPPGQDPVLSSRPAPFQVTPDTAPAATNDSNFFAGNPPVQDLSALLSGTFKETKYKWYGFVRLDGIYDFRPIKSTDDFVTSSIPVPQGRGQNAVLTPRYSRLGWDTETPIESLDWMVKTRIEVDFFNGNTSGVFGSFPLRLRFAWVDFGPFLIGQAASLFMDYDVFPNVIDYEGPGGMVLMRQPLAAVRLPICDKVKFAIGVEQPYSDIQWFEDGGWVVNPNSGIISTPGIGRNVQDWPDLTSNIRYVGDYGHLQLAGIARKLTFQPGPGNSALDELGYGVNFTGTFHPFAWYNCVPKSGDESTPCSRSRFLWQFATGRGINRYIQDVNGLGLDATFDPANGFRTIPSYGWFVAYEQWWTKQWISNFTYGQDAMELTNTLPGSTYQRANYVSANIIWLPVSRMGVGLEFLYGFHKDKDGQRGEDSRIQMGFQYRF
jgi:hypothetical protein